MMRVGGVVGIATLVACSAPVRRATPPPVERPDAAIDAVAPDAAPELVTEADYTLPVATPAISDCRPMKTSKAPVTGTPTPKSKTYDFQPIKVVPLRHGPSIAERPYVGYDRTRDTGRRAFARRSTDISACWRWASARGANETTLVVELTLDRSGASRDVSVTSGQAGDDELVKCVTEMLQAPTGGPPRARALRVHTFLAFNNDMAPPAKPLRRPKPTKLDKRAHASALQCPPDDGIVDETYLPLLVVTNFDPARSPDKKVMPIRDACTQKTADVNKMKIRVGLLSMKGTLDTCYADALARTPSLAGGMTATFMFDVLGHARDVNVSGAGDDALHTCFRRELEALWVEPADSSQWMNVNVNLSFELTPTLPTSTDPAALLEAGDWDAALERWASMLRVPHLPYEGCVVHANILLAMSKRAPWLDDERVRRAIGELAESALALPVEQGRACVATATSVLSSYLRVRDPADSAYVAMRHLERYEAALPLAPLVEGWGSGLRWLRAARLLETARASDGEAELEELASDPVVGAKVTEWLAKRAARPELLDDTCSTEPFIWPPRRQTR